MENKRSERENYNKNGLIVACIVCIIGVCFNMSKVALAGAILLCFVQLVDLLWYIIEIKCKDCKNIKQVFCKCKNVEIINEWDGIDTKFAKCTKCGKYFMINEKMNASVVVDEEDYEKHLKIFNIMIDSREEFNKELEILAEKAKEICGINDKEKENKE